MIAKPSSFQSNIATDEEGATLVEFAIIAPTFLLLLMGILDFGFNAYMRSIVDGAIQEAARDSTLEGAAVGGATDLIDQRLAESIQNLLPNLPVLANDTDLDSTNNGIKIKRLSYFDFADVNRPEAYTDSNGNSECDNGEPFEDENSNGVWDADVGEEGLGGARDVVLYTVDVKYDRLFPLYGLMKLSQDVTVSASTVLQNQPYAQQDAQITVTPGTC